MCAIVYDKCAATLVLVTLNALSALSGGTQYKAKEVWVGASIGLSQSWVTENDLFIYAEAS